MDSFARTKDPSSSATKNSVLPEIKPWIWDVECSRSRLQQKILDKAGCLTPKSRGLSLTSCCLSVGSKTLPPQKKDLVSVHPRFFGGSGFSSAVDGRREGAFSMLGSTSTARKKQKRVSYILREEEGRYDPSLRESLPTTMSACIYGKNAHRYA
jgi:hypothetical protein